jgi:hypothetical protein
MLDVYIEGGEPASTKSGHARCLDRRWGRRRDLQQPGGAMQGTCVDAAAVLQWGEEEPGGAMKTMRERRREGSLQRPCEVTAMIACSDATAWWDSAATGRESVQRRENHERRTCRRRNVGSVASQVFIKFWNKFFYFICINWNFTRI